MPAAPTIKICGLTAPDAVAAVNEIAADMAGLNFIAMSPRCVTPRQACDLAAGLAPTVRCVALTMDAHDDELDAIVSGTSPNMLQLHGTETPERVAQVKARFGLPVIKALAIAGAGDLKTARLYEDAADWLLFDAKPPTSLADALPGGNGLVFDWRLLQGFTSPCPWMLAGGLDADNVADAIRISGAKAVDVSSGVESAPGRKDPERIRRFAAAARA